MGYDGGGRAGAVPPTGLLDYYDFVVDFAGGTTRAFKPSVSTTVAQSANANFKVVMDAILDNNVSILFLPTTSHQLTEVAGVPVTVTGKQNILLESKYPCPHSGDGAVKINVTAGDSGFRFLDCKSVTVRNLHVEGVYQQSNPYGVRFEKSAVNVDAMKVEGCQITDFDEPLSLFEAYGSSRGNRVTETSLWPDELAGTRGLHIQDASHWTFTNLGISEQGAAKQSYGVNIVAGDDAYSERLTFVNCQVINLGDGLRFNTAGQLGHIVWLGGMLESNTNHLHLVQNPTSRKTFLGLGPDSLNSIAKDFAVTAGEMYMTMVEPYWFSAADIDSGVKYGILSAMLQGQEAAFRERTYNQMHLGGSTGDDTLTNNATTYLYPDTVNGGFAAANRTRAELLVPYPGTVTRLRVRVSATPLGADTWTFTVMNGAVATGVTVTIANPDVFAETLNTEANFNNTDYMSIRVVPAGDPVAAYANWSIVYEPGIQHA